MPNSDPIDISPVEPPRQFDRPQMSKRLVEADRLVQASQGRQQFQVTGAGLTAAVADTGLNLSHVDFAGRIAAQRNFTSDNGDDPHNAADGQGHGTNVSGIIVANGDHTGMAPGARVAPLKVLSNTGSGSFAAVADALQWVIDHREEHNITVVCMSLGDGGNYVDDDDFAQHDIQRRVAKLRKNHVPVCIAAGNDFFKHESAQGMAFPGILRHAVSVGAVYDEFEGPFTYRSGAHTDASGPDRITPFSQRLHPSVSEICRTDIFAPGAPIRSSGIDGPNGESVQSGTSQAAPVVAGILMLMQEFHLRETARMPSVDQLVEWLRRGGAVINDGDDEVDNVTNTKLDFIRLNAIGALDAIRRDLQKQLLITGEPLRANVA
ncbi:MAG: S8 family serine peptidase [Alphaproteobacteria bacterium]